MTREAAPVSRQDRLDLWVILALTLVGLILRAWRLGGLGLVHFDEGVYALSGLWSVPGYGALYGNQILISPPLFFSLIGIGYRLLGASDQVAILVSVIAGTLTIPLAGWFVRRWFGGAAGVAAAALVTFSEFHIVYSRMALTDVTFTFLFLLSLALIATAFARESFRWSVLAGIATGATWNTKYHGFFPLVIAGAALVGMALAYREERPRWRRRLLYLVVMGGVAALCYLPWALYIQAQPGGYLEFAAYQRKYLESDWLINLYRQAQMQWLFNGWLSRLAPALAYLLVLLTRWPRPAISRTQILLSLLLLGALGVGLSGVGVAAALGVVAALLRWRARSFAAWLLLASFGVLLLMTPLYQPYPRLLLPWVLSAYLLGGLAIGQLLLADAVQWRAGRWWPALQRAALAVAVFSPLVFFGGNRIAHLQPGPRTWLATGDMRHAATTMWREIPPNSRVLVQGEPEVVYYLRLAGVDAVPIDAAITDPRVTPLCDVAGRDLFYVTGVYAEHRDLASADIIRRLQPDRLRLVERFPVQVNDVRLFNDFTPDAAWRYRQTPTGEHDLRLYQVIMPIAVGDRGPMQEEAFVHE